MRLLESSTIYANPDPLLVSRQALFPGLLQLPDGDIVALLSIGQAFDAADMRSFVSRSSDEGRTWSPPVRLHDHEFVPREQEAFKPMLLADGSLLATGYVFVRPDPLQPIVDPQTLEVPQLRVKVSRSRDGGRSWTVPRAVDIEGAPLEMSGPGTQLASGRIIVATSPFHLRRDGHSGWIVASDDDGDTWFKLGEFFRAPRRDIHAWECRLAAWGEGSVAAMWWAYDHTAETNLSNHIAFSFDAGVTFGPAVDTGVRGQSSNLMHLEADTLLTIHAHREVPAALTVRRVDVRGGGFRIEQELDLFASAAMGSTTADMKQQFGDLKFGQPAVMKLAGGGVLAYCWAFEDHKYVIRSFRIAL
jgi:sialidase-1